MTNEVASQDYRGRRLSISPGWTVAVFKGTKELYSTSPNFSSREEAVAAARALVDIELAGHTVTAPSEKGAM